MFILEEHFRTGLLVYIWTKYFWLQILQARQRNILNIYRTVPMELKDVWDKEKYEKRRVLALYRSGFQFCKDTISTVVTTSLVVFDGFRTLWDKSGEILAYLGYDESSVILQNVIFVTLLNSLNFFINLPFAVYEVYVMEGSTSDSRLVVETHRVTMSSAILGHIVTQMIIFPFVCLFIGLVKIGGRNTFIYMFYIAELQVILNVCNLDVIQVLPPSELRNKIQEFLDDQDYPIYDIYIVVNPIFKKHHSQLYVSRSTGQKLIILYNNIARKHLMNHSQDYNDNQNEFNDFSIDEIIALIAHEIGHSKYGHDFIYFFTNQIYLCLHLFSLHILMNYQPMYRAFGFNYDKPYAVGFILIQNYPITELCNSLARVISRRLEFSADRYAAKSLKKEKELKTAIAKIGEKTAYLQFPVQDWLYSFCNNTHPSSQERIIALENIPRNNSSS